VFILAAAVAGNRVAPYFYLCNTKCGYDGYQNAFQDFELSLTLASLESSRMTTKRAGTAGGLKGLYTSFKTSEGDVALGTFRIRGSVTYLAFFPDGNVTRNLPREGLENFDFPAAIKKSRADCGRYDIDGNRITITWGDNSTVAGELHGAKLRIGNGPFEYEPTSNSDGLTLNAIYRPERGDPRAYLRFSTDGRFTDNGALRAVDFSASQGSGLYHIKENTLTLSYDDGRILKTSFFVSADEEAGHQPGTIHLNGQAVLRNN
jgi:hypothetical protein